VRGHSSVSTSDTAGIIRWTNINPLKIDTVKRKIQESGKSCAGFNTEAFLNIQGNPSPSSTKPISENTPRSPPRLFLDRCVQTFFQEWAPLFPVLHRPTFLRLYGEYVSNPEGMANDHKLAQLYLVFGIAALSSSLPDKDQIEFCEDQWRTSLNAVLMDNTMSTLQNCVLAVLYCILKGDRQKLQQHYRGVAVGLSHRLGLHQSQKRFTFGALTMETRKKVFWTLYTVDWYVRCQTSASCVANTNTASLQRYLAYLDSWPRRKTFSASTRLTSTTST
jgi:Fungal specific transcription factor domain